VKTRKHSEAKITSTKLTDEKEYDTK